MRNVETLYEGVFGHLVTSSLVKLYHQENESDVVMQALSAQIDGILLSELATLEFQSALWKKVREKEVGENIALEVMACFQNDMDKYQWIPLEKSIVESASRLLRKYGSRGLRTLDSIQLASANSLKEDECIFLTSDNLLKTFFLEENLRVY